MKSKTCSRGAEIVVCTVTCLIGRRILWSGSPRNDCHVVLGHVHALGAHRPALVLGEREQAELAEHAPVVHLVQPLARQRRPVALAAALAIAHEAPMLLRRRREERSGI